MSTFGPLFGVVRGGGAIVRISSWALVALLLSAPRVAAAPDRDPVAHRDQADTPGSPLDLTSVSFGQRGTELVLALKTAGAWDPGQLAPESGRALCITLSYGHQPTQLGRICVYDKGETVPGLKLAVVDWTGRVVETRIVAASVRRPDTRSLQAVFDPSSVNLGQERFAWRAESLWPCAAPGACYDRAPEGGGVVARIKPLAEPRCFGAASRNPRHRCRNGALRRAVLPPPTEAALSPNARCTIISVQAPHTCEFGVRSEIADRTVALVGDSHAAHWRGALEVVAQARRWRGFSLTRAGCPLSTSPPGLHKLRRQRCVRWRRAVWRWFGRHREVRTVFVSQRAGGGVLAPAGRNHDEYEIKGYLRAWRRLPTNVRQIIVLRDTPLRPDSTPLCVQRAIGNRRRAGIACAYARATAVRVDPAVTAARRRGTPRVHVVDLTRLMCSPRLCFPVVGGVLVHKDKEHITSLFAGTLGPFLLQRVARLLG